MERFFEIRRVIGLGFFNGQEQYDEFIEPGRGHLMYDGCDIYWIINGHRRMSDTITEAISICLENGSILERPALGSDSPITGDRG